MMGESACLRRSFSNPSDTFHEFFEEDPYRKLGESVSFGRYMPDTLNWEKWSIFSENRYLEEAEKSSKPGSVAKMKAYFEARFKKIGAKKQEALGQENDAVVYVEDAHRMELVSSSLALNRETAFPDSPLTVNEFSKNEVPDMDPLPSVIVSSCDPFDKRKESENEVKSVSDLDSKEGTPVVEELQCEDAKVNASVTESCVAIKVNQSIDATGDGIIPTTTEKEVTNEKETKENKSDLGSKQKPADSWWKSSKRSKVSKLSSSLAKKEGSNSDVQPLKNSSPAGIGKVLNPLGKMIHRPASSTSRAFVNSVSGHPSTILSETRRRIAPEKLFPRTKATEQKLQSPSVGNMKSPAPSSRTFYPFNLRTEERAAKRREFFEKRLKKEAENLQLLDKAKVKSKAYLRKLSQKVFYNAAVETKREVSSDETKKMIPLARTQPPKLESKPWTNLARGKYSQPTQSGFGSKPASGNSKSIPATFPTKKKRHENASPNVL